MLPQNFQLQISTPLNPWFVRGFPHTPCPTVYGVSLITVPESGSQEESQKLKINILLNNFFFKSNFLFCDRFITLHMSRDKKIVHFWRGGGGGLHVSLRADLCLRVYLSIFIEFKIFSLIWNKKRNSYLLNINMKFVWTISMTNLT